MSYTVFSYQQIKEVLDEKEYVDTKTVPQESVSSVFEPSVRVIYGTVVEDLIQDFSFLRVWVVRSNPEGSSRPNDSVGSTG